MVVRGLVHVLVMQVLLHGTEQVELLHHPTLQQTQFTQAQGQPQVYSK